MTPYRIFAPAKNEIDLEPFTLPALKPNEVLLEALYTTISPGTELAWLQHQTSTPGVYPWYPGYSGCGRVIEKGNRVESLAPGQIVACNMPHSSHFVTSETNCHPLNNLNPLDASAFRLGSIALQGIHKAQLKLGESVAVLGLGPIGLLAAQLAKAAGAYVEGIDLLKWRRDLGLACGLDKVSEQAAPKSFDVVVEVTGVPSVIPAAFKLAKERGRVILLGSPRGITSEVDFYTHVHHKGITIIGAHERNRAEHSERLEQTHLKDETTCLELLAAERVKVRPLISEVVAPQEASGIYKRLAKREEGLLLAAFDWQKRTRET